MNTQTVTITTAALIIAVSAASASPVTMDWATVGNAGNAPDPTTGFGAVGYDYRIGQYEVTNAQYAAFLNAVASSDPNDLYNPNMTSDPRGGIIRLGNEGSYIYTPKANMSFKPVNFVSWYDAARFSNWMTNGQGAGGTEIGVYTLTGPTSVSAIVARDLSDPTQVFLPNEDEWYKAAYHQPEAQGGDADDYWLYATRSNSDPTIAAATAFGDVANPGHDVANYFGGADWNGENGHLTTVGSAGSTSFYGAFDMNGNVFEWNQTPFGSERGLRGGAWSTAEDFLQSSQLDVSSNPSNEFSSTGFRVASPVPAPGSAALLALAGVAASHRRRRGQLPSRGIVNAVESLSDSILS
jgi:sulfatase modifying factor 1